MEFYRLLRCLTGPSFRQMREQSVLSAANQAVQVLNFTLTQVVLPLLLEEVVKYDTVCTMGIDGKEVSLDVHTICDENRSYERR